MPDDTTQAPPPLPWRVDPDDRPKPSSGVYAILAADDHIVCSISPREVAQIIVDAVNGRADPVAALRDLLYDYNWVAAIEKARAALAKTTGGGDV